MTFIFGKPGLLVLLAVGMDCLTVVMTASRPERLTWPNVASLVYFHLIAGFVTALIGGLHTVSFHGYFWRVGRLFSKAVFYWALFTLSY
jgi:hypothetical protein